MGMHAESGKVGTDGKWLVLGAGFLGWLFAGVQLALMLLFPHYLRFLWIIDAPPSPNTISSTMATATPESGTLSEVMFRTAVLL